MELTLSSGDSVLAVVAHPDDMEYGASAAVAAWTRQGVDVDYLLLTHGEAGIAGLNPPETSQVRAREQREACDVVGVRDLRILNFPDGQLEHSLQLRREIAAQIRAQRPSVILVQNFDVIVPWGINHVDHRVAGLATIDAARDAANEWVFPELGQPHQTQRVLISGHPEPNCAVRVLDDDIRRGIDSLRHHRRYLAALPDHEAPENIVRQAAKAGADLLEAGDDVHGIAFTTLNL